MICNRPNVATLASINTATPTSMHSTNTMPAWQPPTRSPPPMTRPGKFTTTLTLLTIAGLGLTSCASDDDAPAEADQQHEVEALIATDARDDQQAAGGAAVMAMELGFNQVEIGRA